MAYRALLAACMTTYFVSAVQLRSVATHTGKTKTFLVSEGGLFGIIYRHVIEKITIFIFRKFRKIRFQYHQFILNTGKKFESQYFSFSYL